MVNCHTTHWFQEGGQLVYPLPRSPAPPDTPAAYIFRKLLQQGLHRPIFLIAGLRLRATAATKVRPFPCICTHFAGSALDIETSNVHVAIFGSYNTYDFPVPTKQSPENFSAAFARCWRLWTSPSRLPNHAVSLDFVPGPAEELPVVAPAAGQWPSSTSLW